jgi:hypothetical protein
LGKGENWKYDVEKLNIKRIMDKNGQKVGKLLLECGMQQRNCEDKWQYIEKVTVSFKGGDQS